MKLITLFITVLLFNCGGTKEMTAMAEKSNNLTSGIYTVSTLNGEAFTNLTLEFDVESKKVSGFSGCNRFFGDYTANGNQLLFGALATTRKMCGSEENTKERSMLKALAEVNSFSVSGTTLHFKNNDVVVLVAEQKDDNKIGQSETLTLTYSAVTRGSYKTITLENKTVSWVNARNAKAETLKLDDGEWAQIMTLVNAIDLNTVPELEAPSTERFHDGAAIGGLSITKNEKMYSSQPFDAGNPNAVLVAIIEKMISLTNSKK